VPEMGKVLDIAAFDNLSVAVGHNRIIYIWGNFYFDRVLNQINSPFPTKFSTIHDVFAYSDLNVMHKPLTVFTNIEEILNILESVGAAFDDAVCFLLLYWMYFFTLYGIKLNIYIIHIFSY